MYSSKVIVTVAVTGAISDPTNPAIPIKPIDIVDSALEAYEAGASIAHIHVRDIDTGAPSMELQLYEEVVQRIRSRSNMVINLSTGAGARFVPNDEEPIGLASDSTLCIPRKRIEHVLLLKPEICSLDVGSLNFDSFVFVNAMSHVRWMAEQLRDANVKPEMEVFDLGHIEIAKHLFDTGKVTSPPLFQLCMGVHWGIKATPQDMIIMTQRLPSDAIWAGFGIGPAAFPMLAQSVLLGGNVRIGFEDTVYLEKGKRASSNKELVEKAVKIIRALGKEPATSEEARALLQLV